MIVDWGSIIEKVPELASVIAVIWFAIRLTEIYQVSVKNIIQMQQENGKTTMSEWRDFLRGQNEISQRFMAGQTEQMQELTKETAGLSALMLEHSVRDSERRRTAR